MAAPLKHTVDVDPNNISNIAYKKPWTGRIKHVVYNLEVKIRDS